ncbi:serine/threonine protein kinase [Pseudenhygromyxa sp. WMMC2535]|uniref:serine/threonine-protein kinase n=1 Tax=Pseudenhygromyxa sp. WMMC2535 TaxID=2712867 RepID=UPI00155439FA|nr:serine/threonine-protein kinase [Pseudenhygromyxa sp. WMMC2535]NVB41147.1 serine/threonine protein kinase [Pseudenhygromyxa sp. WMMC2535]
MSGTQHVSEQVRGLVGQVLADRYALEDLLGAGGMGAVFRAEDRGRGREVAVKVLHPDIGSDPSIAKRFDREAISAARLDHPNIVRVEDHGSTDEGIKYLVMELLVGEELHARLSPGRPWPVDEALRVLEQILSALEHAHAAGIVHRDLKPENVFLTKDADAPGGERAKLVDFGIAKLLDADGAVEVLTRAGMVFGTPRFMSPEQAAGGKIDERSDLYAVGLIAHNMLTGEVPYDGEDVATILRKQIMAPTPPLPTSVPAPVVTFIESLLEKSRHDRPASASAALATVRALREAAAVERPQTAPTSLEDAPTGPQQLEDERALLPSDPPAMVGHLVAGRYQLDALLGLGGMGAVFRARDLGGPAGTLVAVKILHAAYGDDEEISARFQREAETAARLEHPGIVPVLAHGQTPGKSGAAQYLVMPLLEGQELRALTGRPMDPARARALMLQVFAALEYAHARGVVHRDLKPENVFVLPGSRTDPQADEHVFLVDLGLAKISEAGPSSRVLTQLGQVFGTPAYMSPEQARGEAVDGRTDLYAAGIIFYELLAGHPPFVGDPVILLHAQIQTQPMALPKSVPPALREFVDALLVKDRERRMPDAATAWRALEQADLERRDPLPTGTIPALVPASASAPIVIDPSAPTGPQPNLGTQATGPSPALPPPQPRASQRQLALAAAAALVLITIGALAFAWSGDDPESRTSGEDLVGLRIAEDPDSPIPKPDESVYLEIDRTLLAKERERALELIRVARDRFPADAGLLWREGRALSGGRDKGDRIEALLRYAEALEADPSLSEETEFEAELLGLLRDPKLRETAVDLAVRELGASGHSFLLEVINDTEAPPDYDARQRILGVLRGDPSTWARVDLPRQRALDLDQAHAAKQPCTAFSSALAEAVANPDPAIFPTLYARGLEVPEAPGAGESAEQCSGLDDALAAARKQLAKAHPEAAALQRAGGRKKKSNKKKFRFPGF